MALQHLRIAILECDTPVPVVGARLGSYGDIFETLLNSGADLLSKETGSPVNLSISKYDVVNTDRYPDPDEVDAVLLTGSKHNSFDSDPWILRLVDYTKALLSHGRAKIIGVCFGHQIVGRAMGAKVARSPKGWEVSVTPMSLTDKGREIFEVQEGDGTMLLHQMHQDVVYEYPEGTEALAYTDRCKVQGFYKKGKVITVQGHPEFSGFITCEILQVRNTAGVIKGDLYDDAMRRVQDRHDGVVAAKAFLKFVLHG